MVSAVVVGFVATRTTGQVVGYVLGVAAAAGLCVVMLRRGWRRRGWFLAAGALGLILIARQLSQTPVAPAAPGGGREPKVLKEVEGYSLTPSASVDTNDEDKIDLDSGEPGYGGLGTFALIGPGRSGGLAEIILEETEIHTGANQPQMVLMDRGQPADQQACRSAVQDGAHLVSSIPTTRLREGDQLCVRTDKGHVALVALVEIDQSPTSVPVTLTLSYTLWE